MNSKNEVHSQMVVRRQESPPVIAEKRTPMIEKKKYDPPKIKIDTSEFRIKKQQTQTKGVAG